MTAHRILASPMRWALVFALGALAPAATPVSGQAKSGTVTAGAEILPPAVTGTGEQEMRFGNVTYGQTVDVPPGQAATGSATSSAGWHFGNIRKGRVVSLALTLPASLRKGTSAIPIDWDNANYALICAYGPSGICALNASYNPGAQPNVNFIISNSANGTNFDVRFYAGAKITVPSALPPGVYSATVTAVFAYVN